MLKNKKRFIICTAIFIIAEIALSFFIQRYISSLVYALLTFSSIALCWVYVLLSYENTSSYWIMLLAFSATLCADFFLTELVCFDSQKVVAMSFFCVTQGCYFLRLYNEQEGDRGKRIHVLIRIGVSLFVVLLSMLVLKEKANALSSISMLYYANLLLNFTVACMQTKRSILFPIGLLLFILCDTVIGLTEMANSFIPIAEGTFLYAVIHSGVNLGWVFYVPSQTILAISVNEKKIP